MKHKESYNKINNKDDDFENSVLKAVNNNMYRHVQRELVIKLIEDLRVNSFNLRSQLIYYVLR